VLSDGLLGFKLKQISKASGNIANPDQMNPNADQKNLIMGREIPSANFSSKPFSNPRIPLIIEPAIKVRNSILRDTGAHSRLDCQGKWVSNRDSLDQLFLNQIRNGTGPSEDEENDCPGDHTLPGGAVYDPVTESCNKDANIKDIVKSSNDSCKDNARCL